MKMSPRLEDRIRTKIQHWYDSEGATFTTCIKEFCQGNRKSLSQVMTLINELAAEVFAGEEKKLNSVNNELLENLEMGIFDLIGKFSSTPGGESLVEAIRQNIVEYLTDIFAEAKKQWNLNRYKITASLEELDPGNEIFAAPAEEKSLNAKKQLQPAAKNVRIQARDVLDELVLFAKNSFRGEVKRKIAVNWLENPEKRVDFNWLAALAGTTTGSTKVILTRIKKSLAKNYRLRKIDDELILMRTK